MQRHANSAYWAGTQAQAAKGLWPRQAEIQAGTVLYRFVDLGRGPASRVADGPWWFEFEHFQTIKHFAQRNGYPLGYAARLFAAILYEWSEVNGVVRAEVAAGPLLVWKGKGKQVEASGSDARDIVTPHGLVTSPGAAPTRRMTPMQGPSEVLQLYVAGLGPPHFKFSTLMRLLGSERIPTG